MAAPGSARNVSMWLGSTTYPRGEHGSREHSSKCTAKAHTAERTSSILTPMAGTARLHIPDTQLVAHSEKVGTSALDRGYEGTEPGDNDSRLFERFLSLPSNHPLITKPWQLLNSRREERLKVCMRLVVLGTTIRRNAAIIP